MQIRYKTTLENAKAPNLATPGSAAFDLFATKNVVLRPGERYLMDTGIIMEIPRGYVGWIIPKSGLAFKKGLTVLNSPGSIDSDYRKTIGVILINEGPDDIEIEDGDKMAQIAFVRTETNIDFAHIEGELSETSREGGFGSTGK